jgi:hypothetical protein
MDFAFFEVIGMRPFVVRPGGQTASLMRVHLSWVAFAFQNLKAHRKK